MKRRFLFVATVGAAGFLAIGHAHALRSGHPEPAPAVHADRREPAHSVWDSVYTESQAAHGDSLYKAGCANCHGATLTGTEEGTPLVGDVFLGNWNGLTLAELYDKILTTMPPEKPKTIPSEQIVDLLAFVMAKNQFPAGTTPLTADIARLKDIKIVASRP